MAAEASARPFYLPSAHLHLAITIFNLSQQTCCGANTEMWWHAERGSGCSEDVMQRALDDHSSQTKTQASGGLAMIFGRLLQRARR